MVTDPIWQQREVPEPGAFYKDNPDGTVRLDGGGLLDVWTSAPTVEGRRTVHLSFVSGDGENAYREYGDHYATFDGEGPPGRPALPAGATCDCGGMEFTFWEFVGEPHRAVVQPDGAVLIADESTGELDERRLDQYLACTRCSMTYEPPRREGALRVVPEVEL